MSEPSRRPKPPGTIEPLATLPVFFKLRGKKAVVAGGTSPAVWKAELLAAAGALVQVFASDPCDEMLDLAASLPDSMTLERRDWQATDLHGAAIAIGAFEGNAGAPFQEAARAAGVPVNVIDVPPLCDFQFGTIVSRSPLAIGISTDGAAPVFGQALRARFEALLPAEIGAWAQAAKDWRGPLQDLHLGFAARRKFWECFADRALDEGDRKPVEDDRRACLNAATEVEQHRTGRLVLVGAGPGGVGYVTLQAVRAMQSADVILHEPGVSPTVLGLGRREARRVFSGTAEVDRLLRSLIEGGKTLSWVGPGDAENCPVWLERQRYLRKVGLSFEVVRGLACGPCPLGCAAS